MKGIRFDHHIAPCPVHRDGVAIGLKGRLAVGCQSRHGDIAAIELKGRQRSQEWLLILPSLPDGGGLPAHLALVILEAPVEDQPVEGLVGLYLWDGYHEVSPPETNTVLNLTLLVPLRTRTEVALKQVVTAN